MIISAFARTASGLLDLGEVRGKVYTTEADSGPARLKREQPALKHPRLDGSTGRAAGPLTSKDADVAAQDNRTRIKAVNGLPAQPEQLADDGLRAEAERVSRVLLPLLEPLQAMFGPRSEVVLHDLSRLPNSVVGIAGTLSGRQPGAPATDLGLESHAGKGLPATTIGYRTVMPGGVVCRSSTVLLHGDHHRPVVALCVNTDVRALTAAHEVLGELLAGWVPSSGQSEHFYEDVASLTTDLLQRAVDSVGVPVPAMSRTHKMEVVRELDRRGFFVIREAAETAGEALQVTRFTIYNYLNELRSAEAPAS